jgi:redox-sensitive bicupin YhaK (pirin superfamily)
MNSKRKKNNMMTLRKSEERGHANHGWLNSRFSFSFADYHDPLHMGLRVINDDTVNPGGGFDMHPHRDMEIITVVLEGALEHRDSMGNGRTIRPGEVQYMAAGTGITHSEFNPSSTESVHLLQIWILPDKKGAKPSYAERSLADSPRGQLSLVASKLGRDGSFPINQDADLFVARFDGGEAPTHTLRPGRHAWLQVASGEITVNGLKLSAGDGLAVSEEHELRLTTAKPGQILLFDLN